MQSCSTLIAELFIEMAKGSAKSKCITMERALLCTLTWEFYYNLGELKKMNKLW